MKLPIGTTARVGEICPETGIWKSGGGGAVPPIAEPIAKGRRFPPWGKATEWRLISYE